MTASASNGGQPTRAALDEIIAGLRCQVSAYRAELMSSASRVALGSVWVIKEYERMRAKHLDEIERLKAQHESDCDALWAKFEAQLPKSSDPRAPTLPRTESRGGPV